MQVMEFEICIRNTQSLRFRHTDESRYPSCLGSGKSVGNIPR